MGIKLESRNWSQTIAEEIKFNKATLTKLKPKLFLQVRSFAPSTFLPKDTPPPKLPGLIVRARPPAQSQATVSTGSKKYDV